MGPGLGVKRQDPAGCCVESKGIGDKPLMNSSKR